MEAPEAVDWTDFSLLDLWNLHNEERLLGGFDISSKLETSKW